MNVISEQLSALKEFSRSIWAKVLGVLTVIMLVVGVATEAVVLYGQSQIATVKTEIARNANERQDAEKAIAAQKARIEKEAAENATLLEQAKAAKATAEAAAAQALADNARVKQAAETKFAAQKAVVEAAISKYSERTRRAEADKQVAEAVTAQEVAKNSADKFQAEADKATLGALQTEHSANIAQWLNNCAAARGSFADCSTLWNCFSNASGVLCR
jgi:hypothetical protein